jgi:hypothetical protein
MEMYIKNLQKLEKLGPNISKMISSSIENSSILLSKISEFPASLTFVSRSLNNISLPFFIDSEKSEKEE